MVHAGFRARVRSLGWSLVGLLPLLLLHRSDTAAAPRRFLTLEQRIEAQGAIERVYASHLIRSPGQATEPVGRDLLEKKVRTSLEESVALSRIWATPVTRDMLDMELLRMTRETRMPDRLRELFAALGDDAFLIEECLARPSLVDRLTRRFFESDQVIHEHARRSAEDLLTGLRRGRVDPRADHPDRTVIELVRGDDSIQAMDRSLEPRDRSAPGQPRRVALSSADFQRWVARLPSRDGLPADVVDAPGRFLIRVPLARSGHRLTLASYSIPKRSFEDWWEEVEPRFAANADDPALLRASESESSFDPVAWSGASSGSSSDAAFDATLANDTWQGLTPGRAPEARCSHTTVWTGSLMIVWGGYDLGLDRVQTGGRYDPATDIWSPTSLVNAPSPRASHTAVWVAGRMIVWGGENRVALGTGGRYDPSTDTWSSVSTTNAPSARVGHTAVRTGSRMLVWGGADASGAVNTGAIYIPSSDVWIPMTTAGAPSARYFHTGVFTGADMLVWGGLDYLGHSLATGGSYHIASDSWTALPTANAPSARYAHTAVWASDRMIVWGGVLSSGVTATGGRFDPVTNAWTAMTQAGAPSARSAHAAVWTGQRMMIWGGRDVSSTFPSDSALYDPMGDSWSTASPVNAPAGREQLTAVWTGTHVIVWGGRECKAGLPCRSLDSGGRYDPAAGVWTPTFSGDVPIQRTGHTAVWTGSDMIVWGGRYVIYWTDPEPENSGGRYDPATDRWTPTSLAGAPSARSEHKAIWTGSRMIVWGGFSPNAYVGTGGSYDPVADSWTSLATTNAPTPRMHHTAIWTGRSMVVWGGRGFLGQFNSGGRYDPVSDTWTPTSPTGAPSPISGHSAIWTGTHMVVWPGGNGSAGGRYDPESDAWAPMSTLGAPAGAGSGSHTAIWTGREMIVWRGSLDGSSPTGDGRRYDPARDRWSPMSSTNAPSRRSGHTAVWTGGRMIVWGGGDCSGTCVYPTGGARYDPATDSWIPTSTAGAPAGRSSHTAVWTGTTMMVWGGSMKAGDTSTGGIYGLCPSYYFDLDGDGFGSTPIETCGSPPSGYVATGGDCNDGNSGLWGRPTEARELRFDDHTTLRWSAPSDPGSSSLVYDLLRSSRPDDFSGSATCIASDTHLTTATDPLAPPSGQASFYLVRSENSCPDGDGPAGMDWRGIERPARSCP